MEIRSMSEAYKPEEKLVFNYMAIRLVFSRLLREQKFPLELENMLLAVYKKFQKNADHLISLYQDIPGVIPINKLFEDLDDEVDVVFANSDLDEPMLEEKVAVSNLVKLLTDVQISFLDESETTLAAIPGFDWDTSSFIDALNQISEKGLSYVTNEQI